MTIVAHVYLQQAYMYMPNKLDVRSYNAKNKYKWRKEKIKAEESRDVENKGHSFSFNPVCSCINSYRIEKKRTILLENAEATK